MSNSNAKVICNLSDLKRNRSAKFETEVNGRKQEGFVLWHENQIAAYLNQCQHMPLTLDYDDGQFFTPDGKELVCQTHGAVYDPLSGVCTAGPCKGKKLVPLKVEVDGDQVVLKNSG